MSMKIIYPDSNEWEISAFNIIENKIKEIIQKKDKCKIMLTGGSTAASIYKVWSDDFINILGNIEIYLTDERCVPATDKRSNYLNVVNNLYQGSPPINHKLFPMLVNNLEGSHIAKAYNKKVPNYIDILMVSLGEDGHIASLFKDYNPSSILFEKIIAVDAPVEPKHRSTITHKVLNNCNNTYLFVKGEHKAEIFKKVISNDKKYKYMSAKLLKNPVVFLDKTAYNILQKSMTDKEKILQKWFVDREGKSIVKDLKSLNLLESGILDSLDVLTLVMFLEKKFKIKIDISKPKTLKSLEKFETIIKLINR